MNKIIVLVCLLTFTFSSCKKKVSLKEEQKELEKEILESTFEKSKNYYLTDLKRKNIKDVNERQVVHLKDNDDKTIISFKVYAEDYKNDGGDVYEIKNTNLDNVEKVICVLISQCFCGCTDDYYYIVKNTDGTYTELPKLVSEGEEVYPVFTYRFGRSNVIEEIETTFKLVNGEIVIDDTMVVEEFIWDGEEITNDFD